MEDLAQLGRSKYVTQSALAAILEELNNLGYTVPEARSRNSIKRARAADLPDDAVYGNLIKQITMITSQGGDETFAYVDPLAMMRVMYTSCSKFAALIDAGPPCSREQPWDIIFYNDEIKPGNQVKHDNRAKMQALYWTVKQFGMVAPAALSSESAWIPLACARSQRVLTIDGGTSAFMARCIELFSINNGELQDVGIILGRRVIFLKVTMSLADYGAHQFLLGFRGASGLLPCVTCGNVTNKDKKIAKGEIVPSLHSFVPGGGYVPMSETDVTKLKCRTDESVRADLAFLRQQRPRVSKTQWESLQSRLGINLIDKGVLSLASSIFEPMRATVFDWFHIFCSDGLFQKEAGLLFCKLQKDHNVQSPEVNQYLHEFTWPKKHNSPSASGKEVFAKRTEKATDLQADGSEVLGVFQVLMHFLNKFTAVRKTPQMQLAIDSFLKLCFVMMLLINVSRGTVTPAELQQAIREHLEAFTAAYGKTEWLPKHHFAIHLPIQLSDHKLLPSCFVHERKHKAIKRWAKDLNNSSATWEAGILLEVLALQIKSFDDLLPDSLPKLSQPRPAPAVLREQIQTILQTNHEVQTSHNVHCLRGELCSVGDVVMMHMNDAYSVGELIFNVEVDGVIMSCVKQWKETTPHVYDTRPGAQGLLIPSALIVGPCIHKKQMQVAYVTKSCLRK